MNDAQRRARAVAALYAGTRYPLERAELEAVVFAVEEIPAPWVEAACRALLRSWGDAHGSPKPANIIRQAATEAGFLPLRHAAGFTDPRPLWWPTEKIGAGRIHPRHAESWGTPPERLELPEGAVVGAVRALPGGRK